MVDEDAVVLSLSLPSEPQEARFQAKYHDYMSLAHTSLFSVLPAQPHGDILLRTGSCHTEWLPHGGPMYLGHAYSAHGSNGFFFLIVFF